MFIEILKEVWLDQWKKLYIVWLSSFVMGQYLYHSGNVVVVIVM
jgi:hypothetical protein